MIKHGKPNPLNVHGLRELDWCPPHFTKISFENPGGTHPIKNWIYENLSGRFYCGLGTMESGYNRSIVVGFEIPAEASYLGLILPTLTDIKSF